MPGKVPFLEIDLSNDELELIAKGRSTSPKSTPDLRIDLPKRHAWLCWVLYIARFTE